MLQTGRGGGRTPTTIQDVMVQQKGAHQKQEMAHQQQEMAVATANFKKWRAADASHALYISVASGIWAGLGERREAGRVVMLPTQVAYSQNMVRHSSSFVSLLFYTSSFFCVNSGVFYNP